MRRRTCKDLPAWQLLPKWTYWRAAVAAVAVGLEPGVGSDDVSEPNERLRLELHRCRCSDTSNFVAGGLLPVSFSNSACASAFGLSSSIAIKHLNQH